MKYTFLCIAICFSIAIAQAQNVGIGTDSPTSELDVNGKIRMRAGAAYGYVAVSDSNGVVSWKSAADGLEVPSPSSIVPIKYQGGYLYVHPTDNGVSVDWHTAFSTCLDLNALGFDDWYLPTLSELNAMYKQSYLLTGLEESFSVKYWSNTALDDFNAYAQRLDYGGPDPDPLTEANGHNCRCVRKEQ